MAETPKVVNPQLQSPTSLNFCALKSLTSYDSKVLKPLTNMQLNIELRKL